MVDNSDGSYIEAHFGTADFCADLNGSGLVDAKNVAIGQAAMGDHRPHAAAVDDPRSGPAAEERPGALALQVRPSHLILMR